MDKRFQITELIVEKHRVNAAKDRTCVKLHLCQFLFSCMMFIFLDFFYSSITYCVHAFAVIFTPVQNAIVLSLTYWQKSRICLLSFVNRLSIRHFSYQRPRARICNEIFNRIFTYNFFEYKFILYKFDEGKIIRLTFLLDVNTYEYSKIES